MRKKMNKYKVYGDKTHKYYTVVTAETRDNAWQAAENSLSIDWFEIESDNYIEPYAVEETE
jgi:hypothetical protein